MRSGMGSLVVDDELVVVEAVLLVPESGAAERVDGVGDVDEVLEELRGDVLVGGLFEASSRAMESMVRQ